MAQNKADKKQAGNSTSQKDRKGDTARTSNEGRKEASGGQTSTNNQGHQKGMKEKL